MHSTRNLRVWRLVFAGLNIVACFAIDDYPQLEYVKTEFICQNETVHLNCPDPSLLEIKSASFGRGMSAICPNDVNANQLCDLINKKALVKKMCDFKPECEVVATEERFGSDCPKVDKYLNVIYACVRNPEKPTLPPTKNSSTPGTVNTTVNQTNPPIKVSVTVPEPTSPPTPPTERAVLTSKPSVKTKPQKKVLTFNPDGPDLDFLFNAAKIHRGSEILIQYVVGMVTLVIMKL